MLISAKVVGGASLLLEAKKLAAAVNTGAILDDASAIVLNRVRTRFLAESGPDGPWKPSRGGSIRKLGGFTYQGNKAFTGTGTLFESGKLFNSIQLIKTSTDTRSIQTDVPYAIKHQEGIGVVKRVFMGMNQGDADLVERAIKNRLSKFA